MTIPRPILQFIAISFLFQAIRAQNYASQAQQSLVPFSSYGGGGDSSQNLQQSPASFFHLPSAHQTSSSASSSGPFDSFLSSIHNLFHSHHHSTSPTTTSQQGYSQQGNQQGQSGHSQNQQQQYYQQNGQNSNGYQYNGYNQNSDNYPNNGYYQNSQSNNGQSYQPQALSYAQNYYQNSGQQRSNGYYQNGQGYTPNNNYIYGGGQKARVSGIRNYQIPKDSSSLPVQVLPSSTRPVIANRHPDQPSSAVPALVRQPAAAASPKNYVSQSQLSPQQVNTYAGRPRQGVNALSPPPQNYQYTPQQDPAQYQHQVVSQSPVQPQGYQGQQPQQIYQNNAYQNNQGQHYQSQQGQSPAFSFSQDSTLASNSYVDQSAYTTTMSPLAALVGTWGQNPAQPNRQPGWLGDFTNAPGTPVIPCMYGVNPLPVYNTPHKRCVPNSPMCGILYTCIMDVDPKTGIPL